MGTTFAPPLSQKIVSQTTVSQGLSDVSGKYSFLKKGNVRSKGTRGNCSSFISVAGGFLSSSTPNSKSIQNKLIKIKGSKYTSVA